MNELLAAIVVIAGAGILAGLGCLPIPYQPFVMSPTPVLVHPIWASMPSMAGWYPQNLPLQFVGCTICMTGMICVALAAIYLGPLFGIIRENSTFGEVVRAGDSKRKRWFRLRLHIQRPSEIAFFYENRVDAFRGSEGLIRWGAALAGLLLVAVVAYSLYVYIYVRWFASGSVGANGWYWVFDFHATWLTLHGFGLAFAAILFCHARNTTYLSIPFFRGRLAEVSRLDTRAFVLFALLSTAACWFVPIEFDRLVAVPSGSTVFPPVIEGMRDRGRADYEQLSVQGTLMLSVSGLVIYACCRYVCLLTWIKSLAVACVAALYFFAICLIPLMFAVLFLEVAELRSVPLINEWAPTLSMISPFAVLLHLSDDMGRQFPPDVSPAAFYVSHGIMFGLAVLGIHHRGRKVRQMYLESPAGKTS